MAFVLKSQTDDEALPAARQASSLAGFNLDDLAGHGRAQLDATRKEANRLLTEARAEAELLRQQAKAEGRNEGLKQAEKDVDRRVAEEATSLAKQQLALMDKATRDLHRVYEDWMQQYAGVMHETILAAVEKIMCRRIETDPEMLLRWTADALSQTRAATELAVAVHPETLAELGQALDELLASSNVPERTSVVPDESLNRTDVVIRQTGGEIRAGLQDQLNRLRELLS